MLNSVSLSDSAPAIKLLQAASFFCNRPHLLLHRQASEGSRGTSTNFIGAGTHTSNSPLTTLANLAMSFSVNGQDTRLTNPLARTSAVRDLEKSDVTTVWNGLRGFGRSPRVPGTSLK